MENLQVMPFCYEKNEVRAISVDGEPWFVARDICNILDLEHITNALSGLDEDELTVEKLQSGGQLREMKLISESGVYTLIIRSNKPQAKPFRRWVTHEVLPSIRKTGKYTTTNTSKMLMLEGEVKEGAVLLSQVIGQVGLAEGEKWQLVDQLFIELFGRGVELLSRKHTLPTGTPCTGPTYYFETPAPLVEIIHGNIGDRKYQVRLSSQLIHWFTYTACVCGEKNGCGQRRMYAHFVDWYTSSFGCSPPEFFLFHEAILARYTAISLAGEPWYVGISPKEVKE